MGSLLRLLALFAVLLTAVGPARAQLDNGAFVSPTPGIAVRLPVPQNTSLVGPRTPISADSGGAAPTLGARLYFFQGQRIFQ